jgi:hypothetical protein
MKLDEVFERFADDFLKFEQIENKLSSRPDLCAFLLLEKLLPDSDRDIVSSAEHDEIYLDIDCEKLAQVATENDILTLHRCGVRYDSETESLAMFV